MKILVGPNYELDTEAKEVKNKEGNTYDSDDEIDLPFLIFEDRMEGWFFNPADKLLQSGDSIAAIHIVTPLIEALEEHYKGESSQKKSREFFKNRAGTIFNYTDTKALDILYKGLRCGFAHHGFLKDQSEDSNILISDDDRTKPLELVEEQPGKIILWVDASKYITSIHNAYTEYYRELKQNDDLQAKFITLWRQDWRMCFRVPTGCSTPPLDGNPTR